MDKNTDAILNGLLELNPMWYYVEGNRLVTDNEKNHIESFEDAEISFTGINADFTTTIIESSDKFIKISSLKEWEVMRLLYG